MGFKLFIFAAAFVGGLWIAGYTPERIGNMAHDISNRSGNSIATSGSDWGDGTR